SELGEEAASDWDLVSAESGIVGGERTWRRGLGATIDGARALLARLARADGEGSARREEAGAAPRGSASPGAVSPDLSAESDAESGERDGGRSADEERRAAAERRIAAARGLLGVVRSLGRSLGAWPRSGSWAECARGFLRALEPWTSESEGRGPLFAAIADLAALDAVAPCAGPEMFGRIVRETIVDLRPRAGSFERDGVLLAEIAAARGLTFRAVVLAGLSEG